MMNASFNKCFVPGCTTGCNVKGKSKKNGCEPVKTLFKTPSDKSLFEKWKRNIPRGGVDLIPGCLICEIHFPEESIERYVETKTANGSVYSIKRTKPSLKPDAVPTIFPNLPPHLYRTLKRVAPPTIASTVRKKPKNSSNVDCSDSNQEESECISKSNTLKLKDSSNDIVNDSEISSSLALISDKSLESSCNTVHGKKVTSSTQDCSEFAFLQTPISNLFHLINGDEFLYETQYKKVVRNSLTEKNTGKDCKGTDHLKNQNNRDSPDKTNSKYKSRDLFKDQSTPNTIESFQIIIAEGCTGNAIDGNEGFNFRFLKDNIEDVRVPSWHWSCSFLRNSIAFLDWGNNFETRKKVIINYDMKYKIFIMDKEVFIKGFEGPNSFQDLQKLLLIVDKISLCQGIELGEEKRWSKNCFGFAPPTEEGTENNEKKKCEECIQEIENALNLEKRNEEKRIRRVQKLSNALSLEKLKNKGMSIMIQKLRHKIDQLNSQLKISKPISSS